MLTRKRQIASKVESNEGVAESLAAADAKLLCYDPKVEFEPERFTRNPSMKSLSKMGKVNGKVPGMFSFGLLMRGSGTATTDAEWIKHLRASGFSVNVLYTIDIGAVTSGPFTHGETITGGNSGATGRVIKQTANGASAIYFVAVGSSTFESAETITGGTSGATATTGSTPSVAGRVYLPTSTQSLVPSLTVGGYFDGIRKLLVGCRGNVVFNCRVGEPVRMDFSGMGAKSAVADISMLSATYETTKPPALLSAALTIGEYSAKVREITLDMQNQLAPDDDANAAVGVNFFEVADRDPVGSFNPKMVLVADNDFYTHWFSDTEKILEFTIGATTGNKYQIYCPKVQYDKVEDADADGIHLAQIPFTLNQCDPAGDDEIAILAL